MHNAAIGAKRSNAKIKGSTFKLVNANKYKKQHCAYKDLKKIIKIGDNSLRGRFTKSAEAALHSFAFDPRRDARGHPFCEAASVASRIHLRFGIMRAVTYLISTQRTEAIGATEKNTGGSCKIFKKSENI
jgi:hypothetical protein